MVYFNRLLTGSPPWSTWIYLSHEPLLCPKALCLREEGETARHLRSRSGGDGDEFVCHRRRAEPVADALRGGGCLWVPSTGVWRSDHWSHKPTWHNVFPLSDRTNVMSVFFQVRAHQAKVHQQSWTTVEHEPYKKHANQSQPTTQTIPTSSKTQLTFLPKTFKIPQQKQTITSPLRQTKAPILLKE